MNEPANTLVLGLGNPILGDDAVGWRVVEVIARELAGLPNVAVCTCCRGGIELMEEMVGFDRVVIVDAIVSAAEPGTVRVLHPGELPTRHCNSAHDATLEAALALGRRVGARLPLDDDIVLVAVEASDVSTFSERCTPAVQAAIPVAAATIRRVLSRSTTRPDARAEMLT
ncbi:MAG: hydrogenase maturation protease [Planctomycetes bacterium]|nr:hydrogenase maturation protease [Planctomycetota bacterium]